MISKYKRQIIKAFIGISAALICACHINTNADNTKTNALNNNLQSNSKPKPERKVISIENSSFGYMYWGNESSLLMNDWYIVFAGSVTEIKEAEKRRESEPPAFKTGKVKIEKVFLNIPAGDKIMDIRPGMYFRGEGFEELKKGDKVIIFINQYYENDYAYTGISGTNTRLGLKVTNWDEPIISALEKSVQCDSVEETWIEGHKQNIVSKAPKCGVERNKRILEDEQLMEIWRRYDPEGINQILEYQEIINSEEN